MDDKFWNESGEELFVDKFVGCEKLLAIVDEAVADVPNRHLIAFVGEGGIGKTALLRRIYNTYKYERNIIIVRLDYSQSNFQSVATVGDSFTMQMLENEMISKSDLQKFREKIESSHQKFIEEQDSKIGEQLELDAYLFLIKTFNKNLIDKRLLILSDSVDVSFNLEQESRLNILASGLHNVVIVLAGRPEPRFIDRFNIEHPQRYGSQGWYAHPIYYLKTFTAHETTHYFNKHLPSPLKPELIETIHILTQGQPILLALTMEWFKHYIDLPKHVNKSKEELEAFEPLKLRMFRKHFKMALVRRVRAVRSPLDKALLFLSFLDRRYDKRILQLALDRPMEYIEQLEPQLRQMAFIRSFLDDSSGLLHDEAKNLIHKYAWPPYDPKYTDRKNLARKVINGFYLPEIERLRAEAAVILKDASAVPAQVPGELLAHELEMECLDYHYRISLDEGRRYATRLIEEGISLRKREGMRHEMTKRVSKHEAEVAVARMELRRGQLEGVREMLEGALKAKNLSPWYRMRLHYELSNVLTEPKEKEESLRQAMSMAEQIGEQATVAKIMNNLGLIYRGQGLWQKAAEAYQETLQILKDVEDRVQRASTLNNLAFVTFLLGDLELAEDLVTLALEEREKLGTQLGMAFSHLTKGQILEARGEHVQAVRDYRRAASLFKKLGRDQNYAKALIHLSEAKRIDREFEAAETLLELGLAQPLSDIRAQAERELGALYRTQGRLSEESEEQAIQYQKAIEAFDNSLQTSRVNSNWHGQAQALYDLIFMEFMTKNCINQAYTAQLKTILAEHNYPIIKAQLAELHADVLYEQGKIIPAFKSYINDVANALSQHHLRKYNNMLVRFKRKFFAQPREIQDKLSDYFKEIIDESPPGSRLGPSLHSLRRAFKMAY